MNFAATPTPIKKIKPWYRHWWAMILWFVLTFFAIVFIAMAFVFVDAVKKAKSEISIFGDTPRFENTEGVGNYWFGSAKPVVTIVEFADFSCPFSKSSFTKIRELGNKYKGQVKVIYRDFPYISENSVELALSARCAGEQGLFWPMHDMLFQNQGITDQTQVLALANQLALDQTRFAKCLTDQKYLPQIKADVADAEKFGIEGAPTWFINGYMIAGDMTVSVMEKIVTDLVGQSNKK
ncbi:MAG: thioredoxin domain-containing protein [Candidatus Falkowbacteria bacterium]